MVTKKTLSPESIEPSIPHESCNTNKRCFCGVSAFGWLRIALAVFLIVGAYTLGVKMGIEKGVAGYGNMFGYRNDTGKIGKYKDDRDMMRKREISAVTHDMSTMDPMSMNMSDMGKMLEGKTGDALNQAFLEGMIPHHQAAVDMAKYLAASNKPELVKLGVDIITAQQKEIDQMNKWLIEWGYTNSGTTASGMNMDDAMREHCQTMPGMMGCEKYR